MKKRISLDFLSVLLALATIAVFVLLVILTGRKDGKTDPSITFTEHEISLIRSADSLMRVLTVSDSADLAVLRGKSSALSGADMSSPYFSRLSRLMVATMLDSAQAGVGIAAPQVGVQKRVVAVQRFDKEGEPVEVYPNISINSFSGEPVPGREGCLSPDSHFIYRHIDIQVCKRYRERFYRRDFPARDRSSGRSAIYRPGRQCVYCLCQINPGLLSLLSPNNSNNDKKNIYLED